MIFLQERLASLIGTTTNLVAQLNELNELRERVRGREAQLQARDRFRTPFTALRPDGPWPTRRKRSCAAREL